MITYYLPTSLNHKVMIWRGLWPKTDISWNEGVHSTVVITPMMSKATLVGITYEMWYDYIAVIVLHNFSELPLYGNKTCSSKPAYNQMKIQSYDWKCYILLSQLAWLFTILQNDNLTISWYFFQADSTKVSQHGCWCCQPGKISWYCNIIIS